MVVNEGYKSAVCILIEPGVDVDGDHDDHAPLLGAIVQRQYHVAKTSVDLGAKQIGHSTGERHLGICKVPLPGTL